MSEEKFDVRVRSTPTRFGGRHSKHGFIPDSEFVTKQLTAEEFSDLKANRDLILELGSTPAGSAEVEKKIAESGQRLTAEKSARERAEEELQKAMRRIDDAEMAIAKLKVEIGAKDKQIAKFSGKR